MIKEYDVAIIGGGSAGMSTALYCKRAGMNPVIIERGLMGGQINNTESIENYLGVGNIGGEELSEAMHNQILENDIDIVYTNIKEITFDEIDKTAILQTRKNTIKAKSVVLATGVEHKELGVKGEKENQGNGVSYCAICDGYFFKDKDVVVIGGGDSAFEEGAFLADIAKSVTLMYYKSESDIKAKHDLVDKFSAKDNTYIIPNTNVIEINGHDDRLRLNAEFGLTKPVEGLSMALANEFDTDGVFIYVGVKPINNLAIDLGLALDKDGYIKVDSKLQTSRDGVFAIGDIIHPDIKQVAIAVSDGAIVSKHIKDYLNNL